VATLEELERSLERLDGRSYRAYKELRGRYVSGPLEIFIDRVQGDPFAAPSKVRVRLSMTEAALPVELFDSDVRRLALEDFLARRVGRAIGARDRGGMAGGSGKSGLLAIDAGGQQVLERSAIAVTPEWVEARIEVGLPARGRRILGRQAAELLCERVPRIAREGLCWAELSKEDRGRAAEQFVHGVENQEHLRSQLRARGLVAFVGNGSVLPRESGASDRPLSGDHAVPFQAPPEHEVTLEVPNPIPGQHGETREVVGLGFRRGVTLIAGGGYHGKSTLLRALERGVHPHVPGDGRELVVSDAGLVKIRAEDGRRVESVDIHAFIDALPTGRGAHARSTRSFSTDDASGSTSQAANIVEAIEAGATGLLLDEDTSATNFMVRDARMQALVHKEHEPITPFVERVRELFCEQGVSTVLVMGGCGDYFVVADHVIVMRDYQPMDATEQAREIAKSVAHPRALEAPGPMTASAPRVPVAASFDARRGRRDVKIDAVERDRIRYGEETLDLRGLEQLVDWSQTRAIGLAIHLATQRFMQRGETLADVLDALDALLDRAGLDVLDPHQQLTAPESRGGDEPGRHPGRLARPRRFEIAASINRLRTLRMEVHPGAEPEQPAKQEP
jgi:predicted ABC-class ATPase